MMNSKHFSKINETLYTAELPNGLRINVVTKPGFELGSPFLRQITAVRTVGFS